MKSGRFVALYPDVLHAMSSFALGLTASQNCLNPHLDHIQSQNTSLRLKNIHKHKKRGSPPFSIGLEVLSSVLERCCAKPNIYLCAKIYLRVVGSYT